MVITRQLSLELSRAFVEFQPASLGMIYHNYRTGWWMHGAYRNVRYGTCKDVSPMIDNAEFRFKRGEISMCVRVCVCVFVFTCSFVRGKFVVAGKFCGDSPVTRIELWLYVGSCSGRKLITIARRDVKLIENAKSWRCCVKCLVCVCLKLSMLFELCVESLIIREIGQMLQIILAYI